MARMVTPIVKRGPLVKEGRGFSLGELMKLSLNVGEARRLGIPVDERRSTCYEENVERLKIWLAEAEKTGFRAPKPRQSSKMKRGRVYRGLTSSGKEMRGLRKKRGLRKQ
ncbi:ribosomal protein L13e [Candidatus Bathyarchaeota archaeon]|nr:ribosomal protein L13e [Candidatus Bathyarchaeota archaeon]